MCGKSKVLFLIRFVERASTKVHQNWVKRGNSIHYLTNGEMPHRTLIMLC